jgi:hypothetical protein
LREDIKALPDVAAASAREIEAHLRKAVDDIVSGHPRLAGYALVAWGADVGTSSSYENGSYSTIPATLIPALAQAALQERITRERVLFDLAAGRG